MSENLIADIIPKAYERTAKSPTALLQSIVKKQETVAAIPLNPLSGNDLFFCAKVHSISDFC